MGTAQMVAKETNDIVIELPALPLQNRFSHHQLGNMERFGTHVERSAGQSITTGNRPNVEVFVVVSGAATVSRSDESTTTVGPGEAIGDGTVLWLLNLARPCAEATAASDMTMYTFTAAEFTGLLVECPHLVKRLKATAAQRAELERPFPTP